MTFGFIYYGHSSLALVVFAVVIVVRLVAAQRRRNGPRTGGRPPAQPDLSSGISRGVPPPAQSQGLLGASGDQGPFGGATQTPVSAPSPGPAPRAGHTGDTAAGWMRDPFFRHQYRYWSGAVWTEHVSDDGVPGNDPPPPPRPRP